MLLKRLEKTDHAAELIFRVDTDILLIDQSSTKQQTQYHGLEVMGPITVSKNMARKQRNWAQTPRLFLRIKYEMQLYVAQ